MCVVGAHLLVQEQQASTTNVDGDITSRVVVQGDAVNVKSRSLCYYV
jgi:hypothetical protein